MTRRSEAWPVLALTVLALVILIPTFLIAVRLPQRPRFRDITVPWDIELFYVVKMLLSTANLLLLICLAIIYVDIYRRTGSEFTVGLIIFAIVLLFYALTENPLFHQLFGFRAIGLGPFAMLPDAFTFVALVVLLYLTVKY
jgi:HJR/Mrr/RecB family endonuclease